MERKHIIIDTDPGLDDAHAILMALSHNESVEIVAITTCFGNANVQQVTTNTIRLLTEAQRLDIPVYTGSECSMLNIDLKRNDYHGIDGFGDLPPDNPTDVSMVKPTHAVPALKKYIIDEYPGEITVVCLGPLTNIALAIRTYPNLKHKINQCVIMGGNYRGEGNHTPCAEFNFYCDPEAVHIVLQSISPIVTIACWELCVQEQFTIDWYKDLINQDTKLAKFMERIEKRVLKNPTYITCDQIAMAYAINPDVCVDWVQAKCEISLYGTTRGQMVVHWNTSSKNPNKQEHPRMLLKLNKPVYEAMLKKALQL